MGKRSEFERGYQDRSVGRYDPPPGPFPLLSTQRDHEKYDDYQRGRDAAKKDGR